MAATECDPGQQIGSEHSITAQTIATEFTPEDIIFAKKLIFEDRQAAPITYEVFFNEYTQAEADLESSSEYGRGGWLISAIAYARMKAYETLCPDFYTTLMHKRQLDREALSQQVRGAAASMSIRHSG